MSTILFYYAIYEKVLEACKIEHWHIPRIGINMFTMKYDKKSVTHRLRIIAGQVDGLVKMIEENKYCVDVITQSLAIQGALKEIDKKVLENHIEGCVVRQMKGGEERKAIEELVKIYSLSNKKWN